MENLADLSDIEDFDRQNFDIKELDDGGVLGVVTAETSGDAASLARRMSVLAQLRADAFAALVVDGVTPAGLGRGIRATVNVTVPVPVLTLLGRGDEPGHLEGCGPIDPETARELAAGAPSFTRILVHPETGVMLSVGRHQYRVPKDLRRLLVIRDETCRFAGCNRPAARAEMDHSHEWREDGITRYDNLASLCAPDHRLKTQTNWTVTQSPGGELH
ncbi:HNH endonuclease [Cryobacterium sp. TMT2-15-1]|uniref:HNH endonuclease signature motif containing protein n=1 Tax=Cryobacterium sp. TMT2-15-1 TaxID=1259246 RepID=UPI00106A2BE0|nr:HNH endonuclease signature motif containing protein [Cryobacterium sp. TMT2-15-1]TFC59749.1 HNH endonuclease [Cryobacterium sp. TMT2-15-1]